MQSAVATAPSIRSNARPARNVPGSWKTRPTGTRATPRPPRLRPRAASRAAPVRRGISAGPGWLTPSGKISTAWPAPRWAVAPEVIARLRAGSVPPSWRRWTGSAPTRRRKGPMSAGGGTVAPWQPAPTGAGAAPAGAGRPARSGGRPPRSGPGFRNVLEADQVDAPVEPASYPSSQGPHQTALTRQDVDAPGH